MQTIRPSRLNITCLSISNDRKPTRSLTAPSSSGLLQQQSAEYPNTSLHQPTLFTLGMSGATTGVFLDTIHSRVGVLIYDLFPIQLISTMPTSLAVPPLLATFYATIGGLVLMSDSMMLSLGDKVTKNAHKESGLLKTTLSFAALTAILQLSAFLYAQDISYDAITFTLALAAAINYIVFDSTKQGLALAALCAVGAPACELFLMENFHLWHYPVVGAAANNLTLMGSIDGGIPSWVPWCYFAYIPALSNLARYLNKTLRD